jgi:hypothetical protein
MLKKIMPFSKSLFGQFFLLKHIEKKSLFSRGVCWRLSLEALPLSEFRKTKVILNKSGFLEFSNLAGDIFC